MCLEHYCMRLSIYPSKMVDASDSNNERILHVTLGFNRVNIQESESPLKILCVCRVQNTYNQIL